MKQLLERFPDRLRPAALLVGVLAAAPYAASLGYSLVWDDLLVIGHLKDAAAHGLGGVLTAEYLVNGATGYYRPLALLSLWTDGLIGGGAAWIYHLTNLLLHVGASLLVLVLLRAWLRAPAAALVGAALFAVHPAHVESVAFVSGRTDLWAAVGVLGAARAWTAARRGAPRAWIAAAACWAASLFAKESAYLLPAALVGVELVAPGLIDARDRRARDRYGWLAGAAAVAAAALAVRLLVAGVGFGNAQAAASNALGADLGARLSHLPALVAWYLRLLAVPWPLNAYRSGAALTPGVFTWLAAVAALAVFALARRRGAAGGWWSLVFLAPVLGIAPLQGAPFAERFLYLPSVGWCLAVGALFARARSAGRGRAAAVVAAALVAALGVGAFVRAPVWRDEVALFTDTARRSPDEFLIQQDLGVALDAAGDHAGAIAAWRRAVALKPDYGPSLLALGIAEGRAGRFEVALDLLRRAVAAAPGRPEAHYNLAAVAAHQRLIDEAERQYRAAISLRPDYALAHAGLCRVLAARGDAAGARAELATVRRLDPELAAALVRDLGGEAP